MSQFCPKETAVKRCVLFVNHIGGCSLQPKGSTTVRKIVEREELEKKLSD